VLRRHSQSKLFYPELPGSAHRVDVIVVYKVDRLTRSLADFRQAPRHPGVVSLGIATSIASRNASPPVITASIKRLSPSQTPAASPSSCHFSKLVITSVCYNRRARPKRQASSHEIAH